MRIHSALVLSLLIFSAPSAFAMDKADTERRIGASLLLPTQLTPRAYIEVATAPRSLRPLERGKDPAIAPFGESGAWRVVTPIRVEVLGLVWDSTGASYFLLLDNFSFPNERKGKIQSTPILRSLGIW